MVRLTLLDRYTKFLYKLIFYSVGFFSFFFNIFDLVRIEVGMPGDIDGSRLFFVYPFLS